MSERGDDQPGWALPDQPTRGPNGAPTEPAPTWGQGPGPAPGDAWTVPSPQAAAGAPRRSRGHGWLVVLIIVVGLIVAMAAAGTVLFVTRTLPPYNATRHFLDDVTHDRTGAASHDLCSVDAATPEAAIQRVLTAVNRYGTFHTMTANPFGVDRSGSTARVKFTVNYDNGVSSRNFSIGAVDENGSWKACP